MNTLFDIFKKTTVVQVRPAAGTDEASHSSTNAADSSVPAEDVEIDKMESKLIPGCGITLKEQLLIAFSDEKRKRAALSMKRKLEEIREDKKLKNDIITFAYATDSSYLRRCTPDQVWEGILRREAWKQIPMAMFLVTLVQIGICTIIMITKSSAVNISTLIMAILYVLAMATSNDFVITKELNAILSKALRKATATKASRMFTIALGVLLFPILVVVLLLAYLVTAILDFTSGPILDVSFANMVNILVNITVVFSALSIGLRSQDPISAIQTFVGFDFVNSLDEGIMACVDVDLLAPTLRVKKPAKNKILTIRIAVYVATLFVLGSTVYLTFSNKCVIFCGDNSIVV